MRDGTKLFTAVYVPNDVSLDIDSHVTAGELNLFGNSTAGVTLDKDLDRTIGGGLLILDLDLGFGELRVGQ